MLLSSMTMTDPMTEALRYVEMGWYPIALCNPTHDGTCGCAGDYEGHPHRGRDIGKVPIVGRGYMGTRADAKQVRIWWQRHQGANVGLLLEPSNLVVLDLDSKEAYREALQNGLPATLRVQTGKGFHYYYRRPLDFPKGRVTQRGASKGIDVLSLGYVVAPPSLHATGRVYYFEGKPRADLPFAPQWAKRLFPKRRPVWMLAPSKMRSRMAAVGLANHAEPSIVRTALTFLEADDYDLWCRIGMCLQVWDSQGNGNGKGFEYWDWWSQKSGKYPGANELRKKWKSFGGKSGVTLGTLFGMAKDEGWDPSDSRRPLRPNFRSPWK